MVSINLQSNFDKAFVERMLDRYNNMTRKTLSGMALSKNPDRYLYSIINSFLDRGGKGLRSSLCIATCSALNGNINDVLSSAAAIEIFHNACLVHDDIIDESTLRNGKPTVHTKHGIGVAVNVGDAMTVLTLQPLIQNLDKLGSSLTWKIFKEIEHMARESVEGQAIEIGWIKDNSTNLTEDEYLRMVLKKTCWYTCIHPLRIGALIATSGTFDLNRLNRLGYFMGVAFQIQDDILNLIGDPKKYGKDPLGDIREGKRTLMLIHLLNNCTLSERQKLHKFLSKTQKQRLNSEIQSIIEMMLKYDSIAYARSIANQFTGAALYEFSTIFENVDYSDDMQFIEAIIKYMVLRDL